MIINSKSKHKKAIANGANSNQNKIDMVYIVSDKIKGLIGIYYIVCIFENTCFDKKEADNTQNKSSGKMTCPCCNMNTAFNIVEFTGGSEDTILFLTKEASCSVFITNGPVATIGSVNKPRPF